MTRRTKALAHGAVAALAVAAAASALAASTAPSQRGLSASPNAVTYIKVGTAPSVSNASLYQAILSRSFAKRNIGVTPMVVTSGAQALPLLLNGQIQFTAADAVGALVAISRGLPVKIVATGQVGGTTPKGDTTGVIVKSSSSIIGADDLEGKTVAVNQIGGIAQLATAAAMDRNYADSTKVKWVELPIPAMVNAVGNGTVDAAAVNEPFVTQGRDVGLRVMLKPVYASLPGVPMLVYLASNSYIQAHPDLVNLFRTNLTTANGYLAKHPERIRKVAARSTTTPPEILAKMSLPSFDPPTLSKARIRTLMKVMIKYKALERPVDLSTAVYGG
jgi:NitT/TauT family transport system substrate-binding protein